MKKNLSQYRNCSLNVLKSSEKKRWDQNFEIKKLSNKRRAATIIIIILCSIDSGNVDA